MNTQVHLLYYFILTWNFVDSVNDIMAKNMKFNIRMHVRIRVLVLLVCTG